MAEVIDSDMTMLAAASFDNILHHIQKSGLNYQLRITPFSANISIKKSLVKDREGYPSFSMVSEYNAVNGASDVNAKIDVKLRREVDELKNKQKEYVKELEAVYKTVEDLENTIALNNYVAQNKVLKEVQTSTEKAYDTIPVHITNSNPESYRHLQLKLNAWQCDDELTDARKAAREDLHLLDQENLKQEIYPLSINISEENDQHWHYDHCASSLSKLHLSSMKCPSEPSQVSHWLPLSYCKNRASHGNLSSIPSLISHYVRLPDPGKEFSSLEHLEHEFKELLRGRRNKDCRQM